MEIHAEYRISSRLPSNQTVSHRCERHLSSVTPPVSKELEEKVKQFLSSYLILPDYLDDAASKLRGIVDWAVKLAIDRFMSTAAARFDEEVLVSSVEW